MNFNTNHPTNDSVAPKKKTTMLALAGLQIANDDVDTHYVAVETMEAPLSLFQGPTMEAPLFFFKSPSIATAVLPPAIAIGVFLIAYNVICGPKDEKAEVLTNNYPQAEVSKESGSGTVQSNPTVQSKSTVTTVPVPVPVTTVPVTTVPVTVPVTTVNVPVTTTNTNKTETSSKKIPTKISNKTETSHSSGTSWATRISVAGSVAAISVIAAAILFSKSQAPVTVNTFDQNKSNLTLATMTDNGTTTAETTTTAPTTLPMTTTETTTPETTTTETTTKPQSAAEQECIAIDPFRLTTVPDNATIGTTDCDFLTELYRL